MKRLIITTIALLLIVASVWSQDNQNCTLIGRWASGPCFAVAVQGNITYIGNGSYLEIVDFSNFANPVELARLTLPGVLSDVAIQGNYACIANSNFVTDHRVKANNFHFLCPRQMWIKYAKYSQADCAS